MYALNLSGEGRILSATYPEYAPPGTVQVESLPEGDISNYKHIDGRFVFDPLPTSEEPEPGETPAVEARVERLEEETAEIREAFDILVSGVTE